MQKLSLYLKNLGVNSISELTDEEKLTYQEWESALNGRQITDEEVMRFLDEELEEATISLIGQNLGDRQDIFLKMKVEFIRKIKVFLDAPTREKNQVEQLIKQ